jgi:hypothetical protein
VSRRVEKVMVRFRRAALIATLIAAAAPASASAREIIELEAIGFQIEMPRGWHRFSAEEAVANLSRFRLDQPALRRAIEQGAARPLVSFIKYPLSHPGLIPALKVFVRSRSKFGGADGPRAAQLLVEPLKQIMTAAELLEPVRTTELGGHPAGYLRFRHKVATGGESITAFAEIWFVARGEDMFSVNLSYGEDASPEAIAELRAAAATLRLAPQP